MKNFRKMESKSAIFSTHHNILLCEIFYNYSYLWQLTTHFHKIFFHAPIYYKVETKFCVSVCKSVCVHTHVQTKRPTASKFGTDTREFFGEDFEAIKIDVHFEE